MQKTIIKIPWIENKREERATVLKNVLNKVLGRFGLRIKRSFHPCNYTIEDDFIDIYNRCKNYTKSSVERLYALYKATVYIVKNRIPGDLVECGVWKGGSCMLMALVLKKMNDTGRKIYLYDTYSGMTEPSDIEIDFMGNPAAKIWNRSQRTHFKWNYADLGEVKNNLFSVNYPQENLVFVKGKVEDTIPKIIPDKISILRLDTDWYESIYHELYYMYPTISINGVVMIDNYAYWTGTRKATDAYFEKNKISPLLLMIDNLARIGIKTK